MNREIFLYTDGGATGNGKAHAKASWAFALPALQIAYSGPVLGEKQTNNTGELTAIYEGLRYLFYNITTFDIVTIITDSGYSMLVLKPDAKWKTAPPGKTPNLELIKKTYQVIEWFQGLGKVVRFLHVNSHLKPSEKALLTPIMKIHSYYNDYVDSLATAILSS